MTDLRTDNLKVSSFCQILKNNQWVNVPSKTEENTRGTAAAMKEEIDWEKEILASGRFNNKFSRNLLENGAKNYMQEIHMG